MKIRRATVLDAAEGVALLRRSIEQLCSRDHGGDSEKIAAWTANKTEEQWLEWLRTEAALYVAVEGDVLLGVGMASDGKVLLNYVSPEARFRGVSKALLARMEEELLASGFEHCTLESTKTAARFYRAAGYEEEGRSASGATVMRKCLGHGGG